MRLGEIGALRPWRLGLMLGVCAIAAVPALHVVVANAASNCATSANGVQTCITQPTAGQTLSNNVSVQATTTGAAKVSGVTFYLNNTYVLTDFTAPWQFNLPTAMFADGTYALTATPLFGNAKGTSASVSVTLSNGCSAAKAPCVPSPPHSTVCVPACSASSFVIGAVGDGAAGTPGSDGVISLVHSWNANLFLYLGDVYLRGSFAEYTNWYQPGWGQMASITNPVIGNHEAEITPNGAGYEWYWNNIPLYYSFDVLVGTTTFHFIALDANPKAKFAQQQAQLTWLQNDLSTHAGDCTVGYWHQPYFDEGPAGSSPQALPLWKALAGANATLVLNGHDHTYQRWLPMDANGNLTSPSPGLTEIIDGTGDHDIQRIHPPFDKRVKVGLGSVAGALQLTLTQGSIAFQFIESNTKSVLDSGTVACR